MKKISCIFICLFFLISNLGVKAVEEVYNYVENFVVEETDDTVIIKGCYDTSITKLYVPAMINGKNVELFESAFSVCENLESITFEEGITTIPKWLCNNCVNLKSVAFPKTLNEIEAYAFTNTHLEVVELSENVKEIGALAFSTCNYLKHIDIKNVERVGFSAFLECSFLESIKHSGRLKTIEDNAFEKCSRLKEIDLSTVEHFGSGIFAGCDLISFVNLQNIKEWDSITEDMVDEETKILRGRGYYAFHQQHYPTTYRIPFRDMKSLYTVRIRLPKIDQFSVYKPLFVNCPNLSTVIFENFPAKMSKWEFHNTEGISGIRFTSIPESLIIYGKENAVKQYAESIGVPYKLLIDVNINGERIWMDDCLPYIKNDRTMVPMRAIFEALGATVTWDDETKTAIGVKDGIEVKITIGENAFYKNGEAIELDALAEITNDRTMVPVRAISEAFGCTVNWNDETKTVEITN